MASPATVAGGLRRDARRLDELPRAVVDAADDAARRASAGTFAGRTLRVVTRRRSQGSIELAGTPAAGWSILSYGRRGGYVVRPRRRVLDLRAAGTRRTAAAAVRPGPAAGDDRWRRRVAVPVSSAVDDAAAAILDRIT